MVTDVGTDWQLSVDESSEWLFFHLQRLGQGFTPEPPLAATVWKIVEERGRRRLVFELHEGTLLTSFLVGQLVLLHKRAVMAQGTFRLCGFSEQNHLTLRLMGLAERFPNFRSREDAVMGHLP
jgi:anti-anti-sigma regulatory factor